MPDGIKPIKKQLSTVINPIPATTQTPILPPGILYGRGVLG